MRTWITGRCCSAAGLLRCSIGHHNQRLAPVAPSIGRDPENARRGREEGRVIVRVAVSADGLPLDVTVASSSGHASLDAAAVAALRRWRFLPATQDGRPVPAAAEVPVRFRLRRLTRIRT